MQAHGVPQEVITVVQQLHKDAQYIYNVGSHRGSRVTTNGIKQGCVIAPYLWNYFSVAFLLLLRDKRSLAWIQQILSLFADDVWGAWEITETTHLDKALDDISLILETLETLAMKVNYSKTAILLKLVGKDAAHHRREHTFMKAGTLHLKIQVHGRECGVPIKDKHEYLGTVVTYHHRLQRNLQCRIKASAARYQGLRKILNGSHHLSVRHRLRLWQACICTSMFYALHVVGLNSSTLSTLTTHLTRHLRAILRIPAHLTHITTSEVWQRAELPMPGWTVQRFQLQLLAKIETRAQSEPDITTTSTAIDHMRAQASSLEALLLDMAAGLVKAPQPEPMVSCPLCQEKFTTEHAMRIHCGVKHKSVPKHSTKTPTTFKPELHAKAGMPACQLCDRQFWRWKHLVSHIETGACGKLGGDSAIRAPMPEDHVPEPIRQPPTAELSIFEDENTANTPLVKRRVFLQSLATWEQWLKVPAVRLELMHHCALCHYWVADFRHVKQHINRVHSEDHPDLMPRALNLCKSFKSHLRRDSKCIWCNHKVGAPGRHVTQCTPLVQLCLAVLMMDLAFNEEAEIFANCWQGQPEFLMTPDGRSQKRPRPNQMTRWPDRQQPFYPHRGNLPQGSHPFNRQQQQMLQDPVRLLTRVVLQQEQVISRLRHDKAFVLFMKQGEDGTLGALMRVAREWNTKKTQDPDNKVLRSPLRTVLLASMVKELLNLAQQAVATEENKNKMIKAEWLTASTEWNYRVWNHTDRRLVVDTTKHPLQHAEIIRILNHLLENLTGEAIQRFNSTVQLSKLEQQGAQVATFALEVSLRGATAAELYHNFERLCGNAVMCLIGVSMKKDTLPQTPLAKNLANLIYQK
ncbi:Pol [Symbiodinium sp. CCMP2456]|nr:Pol [Symbiodinium sp. CCMP2456]